MLDFSDLAGSGLNETILLGVAGGVAMLFFLVVLYDAIRGERHRLGRKKLRSRSSTGKESVVRRIRSSWTIMRETSSQRKRIQTRLESNAEVRHKVPSAHSDTKG